MSEMSWLDFMIGAVAGGFVMLVVGWFLGLRAGFIEADNAPSKAAQQRACPECGGAGWLNSPYSLDPCDLCGGTGEWPKSK